MSYVVFFVLAAISEVLTLRWHRARLRSNEAVLVGTGMLLDGLTFVPIWFTISWQDPWIFIGSVLGTGAGTIMGNRLYGTHQHTGNSAQTGSEENPPDSALGTGRSHDGTGDCSEGPGSFDR